MKRALIAFGKYPQSGAVKTRLTEAITAEEAAALYRAFVEDSLQQYVRLPVEVRLYLAGSDGGASESASGSKRDAAPNGARDTADSATRDVSPSAARLHLPEGLQVHEQIGQGLGKRMLNAFRETFAAGCERVVIVGTDHPSLPPDRIEKAFDALEKSGGVVIGPAEDGGYYLLGMERLLPQLFREMNYSHAGVFEATVRRIRSTGSHLTVLEEWYDVDRPEELVRLHRDLDADSALAPRTRAALCGLADRYEWLAVGT